MGIDGARRLSFGMDAASEDGPTPSDDALSIRKRAMDLLARREHAYDELLAKLVKRDYGTDEVRAELDALVADGLQSNRRFAEASVAAKARRGIGPARIRGELRQVGVSDGLIEDALADQEIDWIANAAAARQKRFGPDRPDDFPTKARQMHFLQRRGFEGDQLAAVFDD